MSGTIGDAIRWRLHLPLPPARVFAALTSNEARASYWAESAVEANGVIWLNVLLPLKAWLMTGVDIRNHDPRRTWNERYADQ